MEINQTKMKYQDIHHFDYITLDVLNNGQTEVQVIAKELPNILLIDLNDKLRKVPVECVLTRKTDFRTLKQGDKICITAGQFKNFEAIVADTYTNGIAIIYLNIEPKVEWQYIFIKASDIKQLKRLSK